MPCGDLTPGPPPIGEGGAGMVYVPAISLNDGVSEVVESPDYA